MKQNKAKLLFYYEYITEPGLRESQRNGERKKKIRSSRLMMMIDARRCI